jgi:acetyl esterase/lipase
MRIILIVIMTTLFSSAFSQKTIPLYEGEIINSMPVPDREKTDQDENGIVRVSNITKPTLSIFLPAKPAVVKSAVIICPGGGYYINAIKHEGTDVALKLNEAGIAAFVLKYRLPEPGAVKNPEIVPLQDIQQAILTVRKRAKEWGVAPDKIGVLGFSAGGHLASTAGTHFQNAQIPNPENISLRPDFMILIYPVISFQDSIGHTGSKDRLLGKNPSPEKVKWYSNELQVNDQTPPTFLVHAGDDGVVNVENSIQFYKALRKHNVAGELHIYQSGGHGFGLVNKTTGELWMDRCLAWMIANGWLK